VSGKKPEPLATGASSCYYPDMDFAPAKGPRFLLFFIFETELNFAALTAAGLGYRG
jgi:hypothetical protein